MLNHYAALLNRYETLSNQHDIDGCVAMFAENGTIVSEGESYTGREALIAAHEYDQASNTQVAFRNVELMGDHMVRCTFWNEHELSRATGSDGMTGQAEFTFNGDFIETFNILPPPLEERQRVMQVIGSAFKWLRENHPEAVAKWNGFDRPAGEAIAHLAALWRTHQQATTS
ncbi:MAG: hypothetical protein OT477_22710 [Chloroflexi bacterium]|nr:hypothetical protein [Chloroflexota bacterium]